MRIHVEAPNPRDRDYELLDLHLLCAARRRCVARQDWTEVEIADDFIDAAVKCLSRKGVAPVVLWEVEAAYGD